MCIVLKADGIILFAVQFIINLHTVSLSYVSRDTSVGEIFQQRRRSKPRHLHILESRFLDKRHRFVRFSDREPHLLRDVIGLPQKVRFTGHFSGMREDAASRARPKVKPHILAWFDMERRLSLTAIRGVKPQTFTVATRRLIAQLIQELHQGDFLDLVYVHRRIFRFGLSCSCFGGSFGS